MGITRLIPAASLGADWTIHPGAGEAPSWTVGDGGVLQQTTSTGTTKLGTGSLAMSKTPLLLTAGELNLRCAPGSTYQTGLAFDVVDAQNFSVFFIDRKSSTYASYDFGIGRVEKGRFEYDCKERYFDAPPETVDLRLVVEPTRLVFLVDGVLVYAWPERRLVPGAHVGVYTQRNSDARFEELTIAESVLGPVPTGVPASTPMPPSQPPASGGSPMVPVASEGMTGGPTSQSALADFVSVQPPRARTVIEFKEPFKVSLDSLYSSLYLNSSLAPEPVTEAPGKPTRALLLDERPKRWYRELKNLDDAIRLSKLEVKRRSQLLDDLESAGVYPADVVKDDVPAPADDEASTELDPTSASEAWINRVDEHDRKIMEIRKRYLLAHDKLEGLVAERNVLVQEMRVGGFLVREDPAQVPQELKDLGYDFQVLGGVRGFADFKPIPTGGKDVSDSKTWSDIDTALGDGLSGRLSDQSTASFSAARTRVSSQDAFLASIAGDLSALDAEIETTDNTVSQLLKQKDEIENSTERWRDVRQILQDAQLQFPYFQWADYPVDGSGSGPQNNDRFRDWLSSHAQGIHEFLYTFSSSGSDYQVEIDRYEGFGWTHGYQIRVETVPLFRPRAWFEPGIGDIWIGNRQDIYYDMHKDAEIRNFFAVGMSICDHHINVLLPQEEAKLAGQVAVLSNTSVGLTHQRQDLVDNGLHQARLQFLDAWNRSDVIESQIDAERVVDPNADPLMDLLAEIEGEGDLAKVYTVEFDGDGYTTNEGQPILDFVESASSLPHVVVLLLPVFDRLGRVQPEVQNAVVNPARSTRLAQLPSIAFVETYRTDIVWKGFCLGELSRSVNLFPGEEKELVIEKRTRLAEKMSTKEERSTVTRRKMTASFEERLEDAFTEKNRNASKSSLKEIDGRKQTVGRVLTDEHRKTDSLSVAMDLTGNISKSKEETASYENIDQGDGGDKETTKYDGKRGKSRSLGAQVGWKAGSETSDINKDVKSDALTITRHQTSQKSNEESKETVKKSIANRLRKVASEASAENKVSFSMLSVTDYEETNAEKETVQLSNPNAGRTMNYHFFQVQNLYETRTHLADVQVVVDPGIELVKGGDLTDTRVFQLEEFGKILCNMDERDARVALLSAIVARQVIKTYTRFEMAPQSGKDVLRITDAAPVDLELLSLLNLTNEWSEWDAGKSLEQNLVGPLREALAHLKGRSFRFHEVDLLEPQSETVNTGSYFMDAEVGGQPATERYLEERREIETQKQRSEVEHQRAQTAARVFFPKVPEGVTELSMDPGSGDGR